MTNRTLIFDLRVSTVPLINARMEFNHNYKILTSSSFRTQIVQWKFGRPIHAEYIIWGGEPSLLLNWFLQRTIIGVEAYIPGAVFVAAAHYGRLTPAVAKATKDPFSLGGKSAANTFYNCLPGLIELDFRMLRARGRVWKRTCRFYLEIRNPLFHGSQLDTSDHNHAKTLDSVLRALQLFVEIYEWIDWWCPPKMLDSTGSVPISEPPRL